MVTRSLKLLVARIGIASLLFAQLALAAYACPVTAGPVEVSLAGDAHSAMPGCDESGPDNVNLCLQHCQASGWSVQPTPQPPVTAVALLPLVFVEPVPPARDDIVPPALATLLARETSPPPLLRFGVLRI